MKTALTSTRWLKYLCCAGLAVFSISSSHREAPSISNDPQADNTDLYVFKSPQNPEKMVLIANYSPAELAYGGPNYYSFGPDVRYEIHVDNNLDTYGDDVVYRFMFKQVIEDSTTFFNIRLGKQNLKTTYTCMKSTDGGFSYTTIITNGVVPPNNIGPRSIESAVGLNAPSYESLFNAAVTTASTGERIYCGPIDDPFFADLGGIFDLGDAPRQNSAIRDGLGHLNVHGICIEADVKTLQKTGKTVSQASNILDPSYVIGVWASSYRQQIQTLNTEGKPNINQGPWIQISRIGMPLTNEAIVGIAFKDYWNGTTPFDDANTRFSTFGTFFYNPELALYMDDSRFGGAVPAFQPLRIQSKSLGTYDFRNYHNGLYGLKGNPALDGTALSEANFGGLLLPGPNMPRSVDLYPIFHTGVPNLRPYQLATGKPAGNPLAAGKPFINNFLPNGGDMLRVNMAVPATSRTSPDFSNLGLVQAAVLGLTDSRYNGNMNMQFIPNMDGFPNGRRLEDDVTRIELQAVSGVVLAAIGLWYDDYTVGGSPVTPQLVNVLSYSTGVDYNDTTFRTSFPYVQLPWRGTAVK